MGVTLHFQTTGTVPGTGAPVAMIGPSLTIGRGTENDVCLPDPGKVVSKTHCTIEERGGDFVVTDLSTNGTFLNYAKTPLGPVPTPLNDGDILTLGSYELMVEILGSSAGGGVAHDFLDPLTDERAAVIPQDVGFDDLLGGPGGGNDDGKDFLDDLLGGAPLQGHAAVNRPELGEDGLLPPLGDDADDLMNPSPEPDPQGASDAQHSAAVNDAFRPSAALIPDDWDDDLLGGGDPLSPFGDDQDEPAPVRTAIPDEIPDEPLIDPVDAPAPQAVPAPVQEDTAPVAPEAPIVEAPHVDPAVSNIPAVETPPATPLERSAPALAAQQGTDAARAFLEAAGASDLNITDAELPETMARMGTVMQTMIHGLREILMTRASIKSEFRIQQTMIRTGGNNPLKFSISPEQAVETMVRPTTKGYLPADDAAHQALDDIKAHEVAMMAAMEAALKGVLQQLSPEVLEGQITKSGGLSSLLQGKKARYWDVYEQMYAKISDQAETDFHDLFAREFSRAYQAQLDRLK